jgi:hypothetical protein
MININFSKVDVKDYLWDLKYRALYGFLTEDKCSKCEMCISERVSY